MSEAAYYGYGVELRARLAQQCVDEQFDLAIGRIGLEQRAHCPLEGLRPALAAQGVAVLPLRSDDELSPSSCVGVSKRDTEMRSVPVT